MSVREQINHIDQLKARLTDIASGIVKEHAEEIINVIQDNQLGIGQNSQGKALSWSGGNGYYSPNTQAHADASRTYSGEYSKPAHGRYNFNWSGETFAFMDLFTEKDGFTIFTKSGKQDYLESIYGEIFKLTEKNNTWVNENIIFPKLSEYVLDNLFLM